MKGYILRSTDSLGTGHAVLETISPETGDVIINNLHLSIFKACIFKQVQLVICTVLEGNNVGLSMFVRMLHLLILHWQHWPLSGAWMSSGCRYSGSWSRCSNEDTLLSPAQTALLQNPDAQTPPTWRKNEKKSLCRNTHSSLKQGQQLENSM